MAHFKGGFWRPPLMHQCCSVVEVEFVVFDFVLTFPWCRLDFAVVVDVSVVVLPVWSACVVLVVLSLLTFLP